MFFLAKKGSKRHFRRKSQEGKVLVLGSPTSIQNFYIFLNTLRFLGFRLLNYFFFPLANYSYHLNRFRTGFSDFDTPNFKNPFSMNIAYFLASCLIWPIFSENYFKPGLLTSLGDVSVPPPPATPSVKIELSVMGSVFNEYCWFFG